MVEHYLRSLGCNNSAKVISGAVAEIDDLRSYKMGASYDVTNAVFERMRGIRHQPERSTK